MFKKLYSNFSKPPLRSGFKQLSYCSSLSKKILAHENLREIASHS